MSSLRADETHLDDVESFFEHRKALKHLRAPKRGDAIIVESGPKGDPTLHARFRRTSVSRWTLEIADHRGRWESTPYVGTITQLLAQLVADFPWALEPTE